MQQLNDLRGLDTSASNSGEVQRLRQENAKLRAQITSRGGDGGAGVDLAHFRDLETQRTEATTRAVIAEEELANYQEYMRETISRYQSEINSLRKDLRYWKDKALNAGGETHTRE